MRLCLQCKDRYPLNLIQSKKMRFSVRMRVTFHDSKKSFQERLRDLIENKEKVQANNKKKM